MPPPPYLDWTDNPDAATSTRSRNRNRTLRNHPTETYNFPGDAYGRRIMYWGEVFGHMPTSQDIYHVDDSDSGMSSSSTIEGLAEGGATADFRRRYNVHDFQDMGDVTALLFGMDETDSSSESSDDSHSAADDANEEAVNSEARTFNATVQNERHENSDGSSWESESSTSPAISAVSSRLLLSSARQNTTNENTFVRMRLEDDNLPQALYRGQEYDAVPLRRQNAIRRNMSPPPAPTEAKKVSLRKSVKSMIKAIGEIDPSFGKSPLFSDPHIWDKNSLPFLSHYCPHHDNYSMESELNAVLHQRKQSRTCGVPCEIVLDGKDSKPTKQPSKHKRTGEFSSSSRKRRKAASEEQSSKYVPESVMFGDTIHKEHLSEENKRIILDGPSSSMLNSGSMFTVREDDGPFDDGSLRLIFSDVNYTNSDMQGFFQAEMKNLSHYRRFIVKLAGDLRMNDGQLLADALDEILMTYETSEEFFEPKSRKKLPNIPFVGSLVDFKKKDLRFLEEPRNHVESSNWVRNDRVGSQLAEWLKISPFCQISEIFFMKQLRFARKCLTKFPDIPHMNRKSILNFCERLVNESWLLARYSESVSCASIPDIQRSYHRMKRKSSSDCEEMRPYFKDPPFTREWNRSLCRNLTRFLCCTDPCLLNLQLNYVLFTLEVDTYAVMKSILDTFSNIPSMIMDCLKISNLRHLQTEFKEKAIFIGSLHRKTGELNLSKVRSHCDLRAPLCRRRFSEALSESGSATDMSQRQRSSHADGSPHQHSEPFPSTTPIKRATGVMRGRPQRV